MQHYLIPFNYVSGNFDEKYNFDEFGKFGSNQQNKTIQHKTTEYFS